jgi:hypothetical protein
MAAGNRAAERPLLFYFVILSAAKDLCDFSRATPETTEILRSA